MEKIAKASDLIFIGQIKRDGSGIVPVSEKYIKMMSENKFVGDFKLRRLSITEDTYIAFNFNVFVVKLKAPDTVAPKAV